MEIHYDNILLQILMVLFPFVLFLVLVKEKIHDVKNKILFGVTCGIAVTLSLSFAIQINEGKLIDLRLVPLYLAFIYGGNITGIIISLYYMILRYFFGGVGIIPGFIILLIASSILIKLKRHFFTFSLKEKLTYSSLFLGIFSASTPILGSLMLSESLTFNKLIIYSFYILENIVLIWLVIYLIEAHIEKINLSNEILHAEKFNVIGQLAASVAHEIRNPMTSVRGFLQILQTSTRISLSEKEYIKICIEEVDRANAIIADYLALGKNHSAEKGVSLDVTIELKSAVRSISSFATLNNVKIDFQNKFPAHIKGNSSRLQQLFINLLKNGIEASSGNGMIVIQLEVNQKTVQISIADNGEGMSKETLDRFGLPFYSTKEKGTGLGLMVCRRITEEMGGRIDVSSTKGLGTIIYLTFPRVLRE
ncbi:sensor histidine kinase [Bacillus sp. FJAT-49736]|uniref:ATP-binding protein n=1 Tax=Bacillus sp. FJAT-49736 TaxID=2833582 RepID=UPI001BC90339|nr:sensor histidine kinase [Bacillus sp. FJAT-49736]MBS4174660.1 ATP-binding protein [Bacillus sp. FJAT-49736]